MISNNNDDINAKSDSATTSPMEAAKGVAKLSGFNFILWVINITATNTKSETEGNQEVMRI
jgi:hypothetical protein